MATVRAPSSRRLKLPDLLVDLTPCDGPPRTVGIPDPRNEYIRHFNSYGVGTARPGSQDVLLASQPLYVIYSIDAEGTENVLRNVQPMQANAAARFVSSFNESSATHRAAARRVERIIVGKEELPEAAIRKATRRRNAKRAAAFAVTASRGGASHE